MKNEKRESMHAEDKKKPYGVWVFKSKKLQFWKKKKPPIQSTPHLGHDIG